MTTNQMAVQRLLVVTAGMPNNAILEFEVEGTDYTPKGRVALMGSSATTNKKDSAHPALADLARIASLCNEAKLDYDVRTRKFTFLGEPTEAALKVLAEKIGLPSLSSTKTGSDSDDIQAIIARGAPVDLVLKTATKCSQHWERENPIERVLEFTRNRKSMSVVCKSRGGATRPLFCKGAPHTILARCDRVRLDSGGTAPMDDATRTLIQMHVSRLGAGAFRCLALAQGEVSTSAGLDDSSTFERLEQGMTFVGICAMIDPPRLQVAPALAKCQEAGIRVIMITGDDAHTAESVARSVGLLKQQEVDHISLGALAWSSCV
jgi:Ca2+ transporting ATPase